MIQLRPGSERGRSKLSWLDSYHTFSFDQYYDPRHMSFRHLRVLNEDWVNGGKGFPTHPHRDMEIITYVLEGALEHRDSLGTGSVIRPGEVQRMSAGRGITHSEFNASPDERVHLLQIWITPARLGLDPGYEQKTIPIEANGGLRLIAAPDGRNGTVTIHQDAEVYAARLKAGAETTHTLRPGRHAWVQVARGAVTLNGKELKAGDGAAASQEDELRLRAGEGGGAELLVFDMS
jgi:redox-sensitive bicupin YhaK (pirin superfamily)